MELNAFKITSTYTAERGFSDSDHWKPPPLGSVISLWEFILPSILRIRLVMAISVGIDHMLCYMVHQVGTPPPRETRDINSAFDLKLQALISSYSMHFLIKNNKAPN